MENKNNMMSILTNSNLKSINRTERYEEHHDDEDHDHDHSGIFHYNSPINYVPFNQETTNQEREFLNPIDYDLSSIVNSDGWHYNPADIGTGITVTYSFASEYQEYLSQYFENDEFTIWNQSQKELARFAMDKIESYTQINFVEVATENAAMVFHNLELGKRIDEPYTQYDLAGGGAYPNTVEGAVGNAFGDVVIDNDFFSTPSKYDDPNDYAYQVLIHEIGHTVGLQHPHGSSEFNGIDSDRYSIMSYTNSDLNNGANSFMVYDIASLQYLYGTNLNTNAGNTVYNLNEGGDYWAKSDAIWDASGTDTLNATQTNEDIILNLKSGGYSSVGDNGNFGIAYGAIIENARSGSGDDILIGNEYRNYLFSNAGDDNIYAGAGNDIIWGGSGADYIDGEDGMDRVSYTTSSRSVSANLSDSSLNTGDAYGDIYVSIENLQGSKHDDILTGDASNNYIWGHNGDDFIYGGSGNDYLAGQNGDDLIYGEDGNDRFIYTSGQDYFNGGNGRDIAYFSSFANAIYLDMNMDGYNVYHKGGTDLYDQNASYEAIVNLTNIENIVGTKNLDFIAGNSSNNTIYAGSGDDFIYGREGNDYLIGQNGSDKIYGGEGNDILRGGEGVDYLFGDEGIDRATYINATSSVTASLSGEFRNEMAALLHSDASGDEYSSIENLQGSKFDDVLVGDFNNNTIWGNNGSDEIYGEDGNDRLFGQNGDDFLYGDLGLDNLWGGMGADVFKFDHNSAFEDRDIIRDFSSEENDKIDISDLLINYDPIENAIADFVTIRESSNHTYLLVDQDGSGSQYNAEQVSLLTNFTGWDDLNDAIAMGDIITS